MESQHLCADFCAENGNAVRVERTANGGLVLVSYHEASGAAIRTELESHVAAMVRDFIGSAFARQSPQLGHA